MNANSRECAQTGSPLAEYACGEFTMSEQNERPGREILVYTAEVGSSRIRVLLEGETVRLTRTMMTRTRVRSGGCACIFAAYWEKASWMKRRLSRITRHLPLTASSTASNATQFRHDHRHRVTGAVATGRATGNRRFYLIIAVPWSQNGGRNKKIGVGFLPEAGGHVRSL